MFKRVQNSLQRLGACISFDGCQFFKEEIGIFGFLESFSANCGQAALSVVEEMTRAMVAKAQA